ncbi:hypothetical protein BC940DRAFT_288293 [Gongronella butleri]|nr:hypothetical protein BC940DRAFT_288293 [Gongronella butleri]
MKSTWLSIVPLLLASQAAAKVIHTKVAILGGGVSGISAALNLTDNGIDDFVLIEAQNHLGGRAKHAKLGNVTVELGCNWVQGLGTNPINLLREKWGLKTVKSDFSNATLLDQDGKEIDPTDASTRVGDAAAKLHQLGLDRLAANKVDVSVRTGLNMIGYHPRDAVDNAFEFVTFDIPMAESAEVASAEFSSLNEEAVYSLDFGPDSDGDLMSIDPRGFSYIFLREADRVFKARDPRLLLRNTVKSIEYTDKGVTIKTNRNTIIADYAIMTFSVGVLQNTDIQWQPALPEWKVEGLAAFHMATYTKIFMLFPEQFWHDTQNIIYAGPTKGLYTLWENLNAPGFFPKGTKSNVIMVTVIQDTAYHVEALSDEKVRAELMATLHTMYGKDIPEPTQVLFKRWHSDPLFRGTYSNWPIGELNEHHENMKAPLNNRIFFSGEAMSQRYYGYLQGAWITGAETADNVSKCLKKKCPKAYYYPELYNAKAKALVIQ